MTDLLTKPGFMDYLLAYEAQGMSKDDAIHSAWEKIFGTLSVGQASGDNTREGRKCGSQGHVSAWDSNANASGLRSGSPSRPDTGEAA